MCFFKGKVDVKFQIVEHELQLLSNRLLRFLNMTCGIHILVFLRGVQIPVQ